MSLCQPFCVGVLHTIRSFLGMCKSCIMLVCTIQAMEFGAIPIILQPTDPSRNYLDGNNLPLCFPDFTHL